MGHKRYGFLPKTKAWRLIVNEMTAFALGESSANEIALKTLKQVQDRFTELQNDPSIKSSFELLLKVSYAFKQSDPLSYLTQNQLLDKKELSVINLSRLIWKHRTENIISKEYDTVAKQDGVKINLLNTKIAKIVRF